jgi:DNA polymerase sigma
MLMERRFESEDSTNNFSVNNVFDKLHTEILDFRRSVKSIMNEMHGIKTQIIERVTEVIKTNIPFSNVEVYGSHAT